MTYVLGRLTFNDHNLPEFVSIGVIAGGALSLAKQYNAQIDYDYDRVGDENDKSLVRTVVGGFLAYKLILPVSVFALAGLCVVGLRR